ncbi:hypothetical protein [Pantoea allii]|uniref:hypothetical protein n=1 Tax=Pantoea allii TaxID=574096 RepID=UPI003D31B6E9
MKNSSVKMALKTTVFSIATFVTFQNAALAAPDAHHLFSINDQQPVSSLFQKNKPDNTGKIELAAYQKLSSGLRINTACDDTGEPCPHDDTQDDMS